MRNINKGMFVVLILCFGLRGAADEGDPKPDTREHAPLKGRFITAPKDQLPMIDPAIDDPNREWCYGGRTTTVLGTAFQPGVSQFTYDGSIYCPENAELHFFSGTNDTPTFARQRTWLYGWLPIVEYEWKEGDLTYRLETFANALEGIGEDNVVHFARLGIRNDGTSPQKVILSAALRGCGLDYRDGQSSGAIQSNQAIVIDKDTVTVDGALSALYRGENLEYEQTLGVPYTAPFKGFDAGIRVDTSYAVVRRKTELPPGAGASLTGVIPRKRVGDARQIAAIKAAEYEAERARCIAYWKEFFKRGTLSVPEKRVEGAYHASLVHLALATRSDDGIHGRRQGSGLPYPKLFLNDYIDMIMAWIRTGHPEMHQYNVQWLKDKQLESGMFIDVHNRGKDTIVTSHGQAIIALAYPPVFSNDLEGGRDVFKNIRKGIDLIISDHRSGKYHGLVRGSVPYDAPMVTGLHACHNLFALSGLRVSICLARMIGEDEIAGEWEKAEKTYTEAIQKAFEASFKEYGWVRSGLYDWTGGYIQGNVGGRINPGPNQDWENMLMGYPTELYGATDEIFTKTLDVIRRNRYAEGVMTYSNGRFVHQYCTVNMAHQFLVTRQQVKALEDLYHILLHSGPTHEGFENMVEPWRDRTPRASCPPPHAWAASKIALFLRNMMVMEYGGRLGIEKGTRSLRLFNLISPAWQRTGEKLAIHDMPTEFGGISATYAFVDGGAEVSIQSTFRRKPHRITLLIPYFVQLTDFSTDAAESCREQDLIFLSPDVTKVSLRWEQRPGAHAGNFQRQLTRYRSEYPFPKLIDGYWVQDRRVEPVARLTDEEKAQPAEPLSFDLIRRTFSHEYARRFKTYLARGGVPHPVVPPTPQKATMADDLVVDAPSRTMNAPTSASRNQEYARYAADGNRSNQNFYWTSERPQDWWQVTLPEDSEVSELTIVAQSARKRTACSYVIEYSLEGGMWEVLVVHSKEADKNAHKGTTHRFEPVQLRHLRVRFTDAGRREHKRLYELIVP